MGYVFTCRLIVLAVLLAACGALVHLGSFDSPSASPEAAEVLDRYLSDIPDWHRKGGTELAPKVVKELKLDDYVNSGYANGSEEVFLYIGQYYSSEKVGAAHDPLVCFPGQGWKISSRSSGKIQVPGTAGNRSVSYSTMIAEMGDRRQLLLYWFQSFDKAHSNTLLQKLSSFKNTLLGRGQNNAFVRISTSLEKKDPSEAKDLIVEFVRDFYPLYLEYIKRDTPENA